MIQQSGQRHPVIIIGGSGFMGRNLTRYLCDNGWPVTVIGRRTEYTKVADELYYSVTDGGLERLNSKLDPSLFYVIIDLAYTSVPNTSYDDPVKDFSENLGNVIRHLQFATQIRTHKYIYVSSGGTVYGNVPDSPIREHAENFPLSPYGITKMACERYVHLYHKTHGLDVQIVRPANIYGPGQIPFRGQGIVATALGLAYKGEPVRIFGDGSHERDYLYIDDFCRALSDVIHYGLSGEIYNVGSSAGLSINQVVDHINLLLSSEGLTLQRQYLPGRPFDVHSNVLDCSRLRALAGWKPQTGFEQGLTITQQWIKAYLEQNL